jgi:hypothetical protein
MALGDALVIFGAATVVAGVFGSRFSRHLARRKPWILAAGFAVCALGIVLGIPDIVQGFGDGIRD